MAGKRKKLGDVIEFPTNKGLTYLQLSQNHKSEPVFGWFVRVLPEFFSTRPSDLTSLVQRKERFGQFFPFVSDYSTFANVQIPEFARSFPILKLSNSRVPSIDAYWRLFNGHEFRFARYLHQCLVDAPLIELTSDDILRERIESGWTPVDLVLPENIATGDKEFVWEKYPLESEYNTVWREYDSVLEFLDEKCP